MEETQDVVGEEIQELAASDGEARAVEGDRK